MIKKKKYLYRLKYNSIWMAGLLRSTRLTLEQILVTIKISTRNVVVSHDEYLLVKLYKVT